SCSDKTASETDKAKDTSEKVTSSELEKDNSESKDEGAALRDPLPAPDLSSLQYAPVVRFGRPPPVAGGRFNLPSAIAVDSRSGDFYVMDTNNKRVHRYKADGTFVSMWGDKAASGLTVDPRNGTVLLALPSEKKVVRFDKNGKRLEEIGSGEEPAFLTEPMDVTVRANGEVFVLNRSSHVTRFNAKGAFVSRWLALPEMKSAALKNGMVSQLHRSMSITVSADGKSLYVLNSGRTKVRQVKFDGTFIREWGGERSSEPGLLRWSRGISVKANGNVIVADTDNERLQEFKANGEFIRWYRGPHDDENGIFHPRAVDVNTKTGKVYAAASYSHRVDCFNPDGTLDFSVGGLNPELDVLNRPRGIAVHPKTGDVFVSSKKDHVIKRFSSEGKALLSFFPKVGELKGVDPIWKYRAHFQFPGPIDVAPDGTLWMIRHGYPYPDDPTPSDYLRNYDADGNFVKLLDHESFRGYMEGIEFHDDTGEMYIVGSDTQNIFHLKGDGTFVREFGKGILKLPISAAIDEKRKRLYVADIKTSRIEVFSLEGEHLGGWGQRGKRDGQFRILRQMGGIDVDDCGLVYVADGRNRRVQVFTPEGEYKNTIQIPPTEAVKISWIKDVSTHQDRVYVLGDGFVQGFTRSGIECAL
ncbi:MAG: NHL repeat-containing protein, partial [Myxococcota bacterium]|nr:NHL repeat-containing protein [Myxococcota bacterium]